jgi:DNA-binding response OmpR family regulator
MNKILIIDADEHFSLTLASQLKERHYQVVLADDASQILSPAQSVDFDFILIDFDSPSLQAVLLSRRQDRTPADSTLIVMSAPTDGVDRLVETLDAGADDFLVKPFELRELLARMRAMMRRPRKTAEIDFTPAAIELDQAGKAVKRGGKMVRLSGTEFNILEQLFQNPNTVFSSVKLSNAKALSQDAVRQRMRTLRRKLSFICADDLIKTIPHAGYVLTTAAL